MRRNRAFTLVEILIVVVILGILAGIVVPQFTKATEEANKNATVDQLVKIRNACAVYYLRHGNVWPDVSVGSGSWGGLITVGGEYLRFPPKNMWVDPAHQTDIVFGTGPDSSYVGTYGWIFDPATGDIWAGSFDGQDQPFPHP
jgi:general secretion pathway protein G